MPSSRLHSHGFFLAPQSSQKRALPPHGSNPRYDDLMSIQKSRIQRCRCLHRRIHRMCMRKSKLLICTARKKRGVRHPKKKVLLKMVGFPWKVGDFREFFVVFCLGPGFFLNVPRILIMNFGIQDSPWHLVVHVKVNIQTSSPRYTLQITHFR